MSIGWRLLNGNSHGWLFFPLQPIFAQGHCQRASILSICQKTKSVALKDSGSWPDCEYLIWVTIAYLELGRVMILSFKFQFLLDCNKYPLFRWGKKIHHFLDFSEMTRLSLFYYEFMDSCCMLQLHFRVSWKHPLCNYRVRLRTPDPLTSLCGSLLRDWGNIVVVR